MFGEKTSTLLTPNLFFFSELGSDFGSRGVKDELCKQRVGESSSPGVPTGLQVFRKVFEDKIVRSRFSGRRRC